MIALVWRAIKGRSLRDGCVFTSGLESKNRFRRGSDVPVNEGLSAARAGSGAATSQAYCPHLPADRPCLGPDNGCACEDAENYNRQPTKPRYSWHRYNYHNRS